MNKAFLAFLAISEAFLLTVIFLFLSELEGSNISFLAWVLQLMIASAIVFNGSLVINELANRGEGRNG